MAEIRFPNINGGSEQEQLAQIKNYLFQLTGQLNHALNQVDTEIAKTQEAVATTGTNGSSEEEQKKKEQQFVELKNYIIKSADVVTFYEDIVTQKLEGNYVAQSEFGEYKEQTRVLSEETSKNKTDFYDSVQSINTKIDNLNLNIIRKGNCYIKTGWLDDNNSIAGFEVGKFDTIKSTDADGNETIEYYDTGFAQFTTDELVFHDANGKEIGKFARDAMYIKDAKITNKLYLGGYLVDLNDGVAFKWAEKQNETTSFAKKRGED